MVERETAEEALFTEKERAQVTLNSIGDAVLSTDVAGNVTYLNVVAERMTGWTRAEATGKNLDEVFKIIDGSTREPSPNPLKTAIEKNKTVGLTPHCILIRRDGHESAIEDSAAPIRDRRKAVTGAVIVFHDVSEARAMGLEMAHQAQHDRLTNLPNRTLLIDRLGQAIETSRRNGTRLAVQFLDLDGFKHINDSLGHAIGDKVLQSVAKRLLGCVRTSDTVARMGGDEFVVILSEVAHARDAGVKAKKILDALSAPHSLDRYSVSITASIGVTTYPNDGQDPETLVKNADLAMYRAKEKGPNNYQFFERGMNVRATERQWIEASLRHALERDEFVLHYQPKINLKTGEITGVEALIRWQHPDRGLVFPLQFISVAEDCGLMLPIGRWVLRESCKQAQAWQDAGLRPIEMAVNVSSVEFRSDDFLEGVKTILKDTRLEPRYLELELTESVLMRHVEFTAPALQKLKAMGVRLAVDDFGTGYSSLSYLKQFPIDTLKVDQSFVREIAADTDDATIVNAVINMSRGLKHRVIAEGVETTEQVEFLQAHGCDEAQGYYFGQPVPAPEFAKLLETGISVTMQN
jgi:diguanylate cyclase (GGDEF)-like protein/PAS domain S-box-containing protein